ncbi:hypothetical protein Q1695_011897 [Nippostrongylus brasiliensis]|nr:hypothetical protein Q1695_011897 [Nippostrongylus brasiliensis]
MPAQFIYTLATTPAPTRSCNTATSDPLKTSLCGKWQSQTAGVGQGASAIAVKGEERRDDAAKHSPALCHVDELSRISAWMSSAIEERLISIYSNRVNRITWIEHFVNKNYAQILLNII